MAVAVSSLIALAGAVLLVGMEKTLCFAPSCHSSWPMAIAVLVAGALLVTSAPLAYWVGGRRRIFWLAPVALVPGWIAVGAFVAWVT